MSVFMRWMFVLLLIANIAFFTVMQLPQGKSGSDPMASHAPYHAEQIRLLPEADLTQTQQPAQAEASPKICLEWGMFSKQELARAQNALKPLQLGEDAITLRSAPEKTSKYWVYIPPQKSRPEAQKKQEELKALGVEDSLVMQDNNKWRHAISLGVFSTQEAADKFLAELRTKNNVKTARSGPRTLDDGHTSMLIKASGTNLETDLVKLKLDFPGTELKAVPCSD
ncbi:MAG: SPOR domain-containing protein [Sulfurimicrobium sp.]|nr:SPOR domain-containing protein [Sulfurimicrobium sp.]MDZ7657295.1 SPOR domain-containing protein [Sulfurimicrobium sp.]